MLLCYQCFVCDSCDFFQVWEDSFFKQCTQAFRATTLKIETYKDCCKVVQREVDPFLAQEHIRNFTFWQVTFFLWLPTTTTLDDFNNHTSFHPKLFRYSTGTPHHQNQDVLRKGVQSCDWRDQWLMTWNLGDMPERSFLRSGNLHAPMYMLSTGGGVCAVTWNGSKLLAFWILFGKACNDDVAGFCTDFRWRCFQQSSSQRHCSVCQWESLLEQEKVWQSWFTSGRTKSNPGYDMFSNTCHLWALRIGMFNFLNQSVKKWGPLIGKE
jgi:hypothetical protein